jgi:cell division protein ZipA
MSPLRWILLVVGALVVAYVYWRGRRDLRRSARGGPPRIEPTVGTESAVTAPAARERREPTLGNAPPGTDDGVRDTEPPWPSRAETQAAPLSPPRPMSSGPTAGTSPRSAPVPSHAPVRPTSSPKPAATIARKIIALRIARRTGERIAGMALLDALRAAGLVFGEYNAFHRLPPNVAGAAATPIFTVANLVEPGELDPELMPTQDFAGVAVFMVLPGAVGGASALTDMLNTAQRVAAALDAELLDQSGSTMTRQTADHLRDEVVEFEHRHRSEQVSATDR